ncbi:DUF202 domain-containing protein [Rubrivirga sp. S365]|uniref:DUF202 domain-containing protein n=1 Tax=Rubrivirga litoralis TaxID=3075598 RepID=A0ABU3BUU7_9BACT|nr:MULTISPECIES: DUF202 domain-containing protein [unclassified Rubrivirga]MDT0633064.1 DUF202 domain-containing protein [Rubrivirga sp. F394]MDT7857131.1 DUF202 domain-containing protein [Rubrivirga sp. S365]
MAAPPDPLPLRDRLALDRTVLANERTLLAYLRTALGLVATGAALVHFTDDVGFEVVGWASLAVSPLVVAVGAWRFARVRRRLDAEQAA